jgi:hypothetical protein
MGRNIILFLSQVSLCKLDLDLASELCQTIGDELFFTWQCFFRSWQKHKICQVKFAKLLEML